MSAVSDTVQNQPEIMPSEKHGTGDVVHNEDTKEIKTEVIQGSVALDAAKRSDPPTPWSRAMLRLYCCLTVVYLCSTLNGLKSPLCVIKIKR